MPLNEACGVFGCVLVNPNAQHQLGAYLVNGILGLQHRGQESAGMVTVDDCGEWRQHKGIGMVTSVFADSNVVHRLHGSAGIAHTRYSTFGDADGVANVQPVQLETAAGRIAIAHNGELVNSAPLRRSLLERGLGMYTSSDGELIAQLLAAGRSGTAIRGDAESAPNRQCGAGDLLKNGKPLENGSLSSSEWIERIKYLMETSPLSYSLLMLTGADGLLATRDPFGNRPLCIGQMPAAKGSSGIGAWLVASESCAFRALGATYYREVLPGEIVHVGRNGIESCYRALPPSLKDADEAPLPRTAFCIFEYVYFARGDSRIEGQQVYAVRERCGRQLATESGDLVGSADVVAAVPESGSAAARGFSAQSGIVLGDVLVKNRYVGRSFIQPSDQARRLAVARKFGLLDDNIKGKRIILVDDSIVRGITMEALVHLLKDCGAKEVHLRIAAPPLRHACYMGINIPRRQDLVGNRFTDEELKSNSDIGRQLFGADSLHYLSIEGLVTAVQHGVNLDGDSEPQRRGHCVACLTGTYPVRPMVLDASGDVAKSW